MGEELKFLIDIIKHASTVINGLWTFYSGAALAVVGWFVAAGKDRLTLIDEASRRIIATAFMLFTLVNIISLGANYAILDAAISDAQPHLLKAGLTSTANALQPFGALHLAGLSLPMSSLVQIIVSTAICWIVLRFRRPVSAAVQAARLRSR